MDEESILLLFEERNEAAIEACEREFGAYCHSVAKNILSDGRDCEECVSDTWLRAWNHIPPDRPNCLRLYLAAITRNLALDRLRTLRRERRGGGEADAALEEIAEIAGSLSEVEDRLAERELIAAINRFLRGISPKACDLFVRRYFHFDGTASMAADLGMTEGAVQKSLSRTREKLRRHLEKEGYIL